MSGPELEDGPRAGGRGPADGVLLFTGFPGFLGSAILPRLLRRRPGAEAVCVVEPGFAGPARRRAGRLARAEPGLRGRIRLLEGDITRPALGLGPVPRLRAGVTEIFHAAALYDLSVERERAQRVNVDGTLHVLQFADGCPGLERLHYVSTCYVSGRHPGTFRETDLDEGQRFNNHYEESKFLAEVEVRFWMEQGLPATVYRPAIVVGDSDTGATHKYDGPYYLIRLLLRQPRVAVVPIPGDPSAHALNVVPRDFVADAIAYLGGRDASAGRVYQLADPDPPTVARLLDLLGRATGRRILRLPVPPGAVKAAMRSVPGLERLLGFPAEAVDYFVHPTRYATDGARADLEGSGIRPPPLASYVDRLVAFVRRHPEIGREATA